MCPVVMAQLGNELGEYDRIRHADSVNFGRIRQADPVNFGRVRQAISVHKCITLLYSYWERSRAKTHDKPGVKTSDQGMQQTRGRCFNCGGKDHCKKDCPHKDTGRRCYN